MTVGGDLSSLPSWTLPVPCSKSHPDDEDERNTCKNNRKYLGFMLGLILFILVAVRRTMKKKKNPSQIVQPKTESYAPPPVEAAPAPKPKSLQKRVEAFENIVADDYSDLAYVMNLLGVDKNEKTGRYFNTEWDKLKQAVAQNSNDIERLIKKTASRF